MARAGCNPTASRDRLNAKQNLQPAATLAKGAKHVAGTNANEPPENLRPE
jgi:hypothetical protein